MVNLPEEKISECAKLPGQGAGGRSNGCEAHSITLSHLPAHQRDRVLSGMRWSVWLSGFAVLFSAGLNLLLARVGPETIGTFGLLSVYIGLIVAFLYFGGDPVVIKFMPECNLADRASFLASYLGVVFTILSGWLLFARLCPGAVVLVLGRETGGRVGFLLLCFAPVPILFYLVVAALKGMLEIRLSQILAKLMTVIYTVACAIIFVTARPLLANHPAAAIWSLYISLAGILALIGAGRIFHLCGRPRLRFYLPAGFWRYAVDTQIVGAINFFSGRLDYILLLNFGGLAVLGHYVAVMAVAAMVPMMNNLFMDTLLPSLTNMVASRNSPGAGQVFTLHMRILFLVTVAAGSAILLLAAPAAEIMGPKYQSVQDLIVLMTLFQSIAGPGLYGGAILSSISRQRLTALTGVVNAAIFAGLFFATWHKWNLTGAVIGGGFALIVSNCALMTFALKLTGFGPSIPGLWLKAASVLIAVGAAALWLMPVGPLSGLLIWVCAVLAFMAISHYDVAELVTLSDIFIPDRLRSLSGYIRTAVNHE